MLGYDYPILGLFWTMLILFLWIAWLIILFRVVVDIFRSHDMGGFAKALWVIAVILLPYLGVFVYIIARGDKMASREIADAQANREAFDSYVRDVAGSGGGGTADELAKLAELHSKGVLSDEEFAAQKAKLLT